MEHRDLRLRKLPRIELSDKAKIRLKRIGVIDVGSNSVRLAVFDGMARSPAYFYNEKVLCGLGAGMRETGKLSPEGRVSAMAALRRFKALADRMQLSGMIAVATAAVRESEDGRDFCREVAEETGLRLNIASGREEARLAARGVLLGWPGADGLACDMGGASMELARLNGGEIRDSATAALGPLAIAGIDDEDKRDKMIRRGVKQLLKQVPGPVPRLFLIGGSWRAIARLDMERTGYPLRVLHGYEPPVEQLLETIEWLRGEDTDRLSALTGTSTARLSLVPAASLVLAELIRRADVERVTISAYGLREGLLYRQMPEKMRALDPLIEACRHMEDADSRSPGFGECLADWLAPLYENRSAIDRRLVRAACLLHDVNWRAHPDYRAELGFESVTRANVAGINHAERVFLGTALLNRYKTGSAPDSTDRFGALLPEAWRSEAVILGRAMRLGAMLSGASTGVLSDTPLLIEDRRLTLTLKGPARAFAGDVVEKRLQALASRLDLEPALKLAG